MSGTISLATGELSVLEDEGGVAVPILREGDTSEPVTVSYSITEGDATEGEDFTGGLGSVTIPAGADRATVFVPVIDDAAGEPTESFVLSLTNVSGGFLSAPRTARIDILDDEEPVTPPSQPPLESPYTVTSDPVITGLNQPIDFAVAPDGRVYVAEKTGRVSVHDAEGELLSEVLDLTAQVNNIQDRGLLDVALHPDFPEEPYLYAFYTVDPPEASELSGNAGQDGGGNRFSYVSRFELSPDGLSVVTGSETVLVGAGGQDYDDVFGGGAVDGTDPEAADDTPSDRFFDPEDPDVVVEGGFKQDYLKVDSRSHPGGGLAFGPDGALYISTGDGTSFNFADPRTLDVQSLDSLSGKILRVDPMTGQGLADNPFVEPGDDLDLNSSKVYQYGLRNPFSIGFDEGGQLTITDTGWTSFEEINRGEPGANFGWPYYEGGDGGVLQPAPEYRDFEEAEAFYAAVEAGEIEVTPAYRAFSHAPGAPGFQVQAITGGSAFIGGEDVPAALQGDYIFTDVSQSEVFAVDTEDRRDVTFLYGSSGSLAPVHFGEGPDGETWYVDLTQNEIGRLSIEGGERFVFRLVDAATDTVLDDDLSDGVAAIDPEVLDGELTVEVLARAGATLEAPVEMQLTGPDGLEQVRVEETGPFSVFANLGQDFFGEPLPAGAYEITASSDGVTETVAFDLTATEAEPPSEPETPPGPEPEPDPPSEPETPPDPEPDPEAPSDPGVVVGEVGRATLGSKDREDWTRVSFSEAFDDPVVVAGPPTEVGPQPITIRVRDVGETGFEMRVDEWPETDGWHREESVGWMVVERGEHVLSDGSALVADTAQATGDAGSVSFGTSIDSPVVLAQVTSDEDPEPVAPRVSGVVKTGFTVRLDEEEAADGVHGPESLDWVAIEGGAAADDFVVGRTGAAVTEEPFRFDFGTEIEDAVLLAGMQTRNGADPASLRLADLDADGAAIFAQEERSADDEIAHAAEDVAWLASDAGFIFA